MKTQWWSLAALLVLLLLNAVMNPAFFAVSIHDGQLYGSLIDIAFRSVPLILTALGMTLVIATGGVDLSVGSTAAFAGACATLALGGGWLSALAAALLGGLAVGLFNGLLITALGLQPIIATLISMVSTRGLAQLVLGGQILPIANPSYVAIGTSAFLGVPVAIWIVVFSCLVLSLLLRRTTAGLFIEAVGANSLASRFIGLSEKKVRLVVYTLAGLFAALSGVVLSTNIRAVDGNNLGLYLELDAILAVVIGGTRLSGGRFSLLGTVFGALIIQTVTTTINTQGIRVELMLMVKALVVIAICLAQSTRVSQLWTRLRQGAMS